MSPESPLEGVNFRHCPERMTVRAHEDGMLEPMTAANSPFRVSNIRGKKEGRACPSPTEWGWEMKPDHRA